MVLDLILLLLLAISLYTDLKHKKIYNKFLLPAGLTALTYHLVCGGLPELWLSTQGLLLGMVLLIIPFALGGIGAGDVKLMGVIGAFKGPDFVWLAFLAAALVGGLMSLAVLLRQKRLLPALKAVWYTLLSLKGIMPRVNLFGTIKSAGPSNTFPYGVAITAGTVATYFLR